MNDTTDPPVEARLRATLRAVAHAQPVVDDLPGLRRRSTGSTIPWSDPDQGRRTRWLLAAAVLAVVAVTAAAAVAALTRDGAEPVITDDPPPVPDTGFLLPTGLGTDWELLGVAVEPVSPEPGLVRVATFTSGEPPLGSSSDGVVQVDVEVHRVTPSRPAPAQAGTQPLSRGSGDATRTYRVATEAEANGRITDARVEAIVGDLFLAVDGRGVAELEPLLEMADRWWGSGGEALAVDPSLGLRRALDWTFAPPHEDEASPPDDGSPGSEAGLVQLVLRAPSGRIAGVALSVPGAVSHPTGIGDPDGGAAAGLTEEERPRTVESPRLGAPAWVWDGFEPLVAVDLPSVFVGLSGLQEDVSAAPVPPGTAPAELDDLLELLDALAPVSAERWAEAVGPVEGGSAAVAADLASVFRTGARPGPEPTPGG